MNEINRPKVAVVILSWNGRQYLEDFLPSVVQHSTYSNCEIVVADNASTDNTAEFMAQHYPQLTYIKMEHNTGFAGGYNEALQQVEADYFVLLNQDVEVAPNWIEHVIDRMEADPLVGAAQPKMRAFNQKDHFEYAGAAGGWLDWLGYPFCKGRILSTTEADQGQYDDGGEIFWASGAAMFVKADLFKQLQGFDASFFAHMEEIDLCWRIKNAGYKVIAVPESVVYHVGGGSLAYGNPKKTYLNFRNSLFMLYKNLAGPRMLYTILSRLLLDGVAGLHFLVKGEIKHIIAIVKAHFAFYAAIPSLHKKRQQSRRLAIMSIPNRNAMFEGSIIWSYYFRGKKQFSQLNKGD